MLRWRQERLYTNRREMAKKGMFVDQKWIEPAPGYFEDLRQGAD
jgi:hypothetical protein